MQGLTYGLKPIPFKTEGKARVFQQTVKSCPDANWHTRVLPEFDLRFWAGACREVAGRSGLPGAQMRGIWGTQILLRRRIPKATGPPAHTKLESKNLIFSLLRSRKDNCRSFDSPPQAELRLGPRSLSDCLDCQGRVDGKAENDGAVFLFPTTSTTAADWLTNSVRSAHPDGELRGLWH
jgi:hypothetical protein